jgi:hypothetical protein
MMKASLVAASALLIAAAAIGRARAQIPPPVLSPPPAVPDVAAAPGMRLATGQAPVVGGNAAGARERAFDEAIRQAVEAAINEVIDPATRAAQAKAIKVLLSRPRVYVPRYRTLEEGESNGVYTVRVEVDVDEIALRRKLERPAAANPPDPRAAGPGATPAVAVVAGDAAATSAAMAAAVITALGPAGVRARAGGADAAVGPTVQVTADVIDEGAVRGTGRSSFACRAEARGIGTAGAPGFSPVSADARVFAASAEAGRGDCVTRLAGDVARRVAAALPSAAVTTSGDLRAVTVDAELVEPGALPALLKSVRSLGLVSAAELTRVAGGRAEIRVRARASTAALAAALPRSAGSPVVLSDIELSGDAIRLRARLRPAPPPVIPPAEATP